MHGQIKQRSSNFELLRIIAMILVMIVHADFRSLGIPTSFELHNSFISSLCRLSIESISIICVNVFVLISGWFGIKPTFKKFSAFIFQLFFINCFVIIFVLLVQKEPLSLKDIVMSFFYLKGFWFVKAYIALFIIAPILNLFLESASKRQITMILTSYFVFQTIFDCLYSGTAWICSGLSLPSMAFLYLLAGFIRKYNLHNISTKLLGGG